MSRVLLTAYRLILICSLAVAIPLPAGATPIDYTFTVTANGGALDGVAETGTFRYNTSSIVLGGYNTATGLLTALDFTWNGIHYDQATANTGWLKFDLSGVLTDFGIGNHAGAGVTQVDPLTNDFWITPGTDGFRYALPLQDGQWGGDVTFSQVINPVPEPATLLLLGSGLVGLAGWGRKRFRK